MQIDQLRTFFIELQDKICNAIANEGQENVISDDWEKDNKQQLVGNGRTRIIEKGNVIERGGVNFSDVKGDSLPVQQLLNGQNSKVYHLGHSVFLWFFTLKIHIFQRCI